MSTSADAWKIGFAREQITPPIGGLMAGFDARKQGSVGVHDELHARALVFDDDKAQTAFVSVEVLAVSEGFATSVRARIEQATGIPASHVFLSATHTHCGPITINQFFDPGLPIDEDYLEFLAVGIVSAVERAYSGRSSRLLRIGLVECSGIAINRRTPDGLPVDPYAGVLLVEELDATAAAIAVIYACHTTVLGPDTLTNSQDFPFYTLEKLKAVLGSDVETLFFNGAEGDLSVGHKSDLSAVGFVDSFRTFATAQRLGEKLADAVLAGLGSLTYESPGIEVLTQKVPLPLKQYEPLATMTQRKEDAFRQIEGESLDAAMVVIRQRYLFAKIEEYYARLYEESSAPEPKKLMIEFASIRLGETVFLTLPGEVFVRIALAIREASPFPKTLFLGLTNNYIAYVPDSEATSASGYEVVASRVPAEAGLVLQEVAADLLKQLNVQTGTV